MGGRARRHLLQGGPGSVQPQHGTRAQVGRAGIQDLVPGAGPHRVSRQRRHRGRLHRRDGAHQDPGDGTPLHVEHRDRAQGAPGEQPARQRGRPVRAATDAPPTRTPPSASPGTDVAAAQPADRSNRRPADRRARPRAAGRGLRHAAAASRAVSTEDTCSGPCASTRRSGRSSTRGKCRASTRGWRDKRGCPPTSSTHWPGTGPESGRCRT